MSFFIGMVKTENMLLVQLCARILFGEGLCAISWKINLTNFVSFFSTSKFTLKVYFFGENNFFPGQKFNFLFFKRYFLTCMIFRNLSDEILLMKKNRHHHHSNNHQSQLNRYSDHHHRSPLHPLSATNPTPLTITLTIKNHHFDHHWSPLRPPNTIGYHTNTNPLLWPPSRSPLRPANTTLVIVYHHSNHYRSPLYLAINTTPIRWPPIITLTIVDHHFDTLTIIDSHSVHLRSPIY
jgi:hypothetical protein